MINSKRFLLLSPLLFLLVFEFTFSSCEKDVITKTITQIDTIIQKDTIIRLDTVLSLEILTASSWKIQELRGVKGGSNVYYLRGGDVTRNTESFENESMTFNANKSGILVNDIGISFNLTWDFGNTEHTKISWTVINSPATYTIYMENIRYKNKSLIYDEYYTDGNNFRNSHSHLIRIHK